MSEEKKYVTNFTFPNGETYYVKDTEAREDIEELKNHGGGGGSGDANVQSDWNQTDSTADDYIKNKPDIYTKNEINQVIENKADNSEVSTLSARVDNAINAASSESEVQDIRVATDGTVYSTAGAAVRTQLGALEALTVTTESRNLWDPDDPDFGDGIRLKTDGSTSTGNYNTSGYIRVHPGDVLYYSRLSSTTGNVVWVAYDALKAMLAGSGADAASYTVPSGAAYVRVCVYKPSDKATQIEVGSVTRYKPYTAPVTQLNRVKLSETGTPLNLLPMIIRDYVCYRGALTTSEGGFATTLIEIPSGATKLYLRSEHGAKFRSAQYFDADQTYIPNSAVSVELSNTRNISVRSDARYIQLSDTTWDDAFAGDIQLSFSEDSFLLLEHGFTDKADTEIAYDAISLWGKREYPRTFFTSVAHRGFTSVAPENTLPALIAARKYGFDYAEIDVQFTSDHVPVLLHDFTINECGRNADGSTISGTINIRDITYEQALQYDFGIFYSQKFAGTKIPTFAEALHLCRDIGLHLHIEIKAESAPTQSDIELLVNTVRGWGMTEYVSWVSTASTQLARIHTLLPKATLGLIVTTVDQDKINTVLSLQNENQVFISSTDYSSSAVELCKSAGLPMIVWTPNTKSEILALDPYISGATSDKLHAGFVLYSNKM